MTSAPGSPGGPTAPPAQRLTLRAFPAGWNWWESGLLTCSLIGMGGLALSYARLWTLSRWLGERDLISLSGKRPYLWPFQILLQRKKLEHSLWLLQERGARCENRVEQIGSMVSGMSHDLKAPIGALLGYAEILERESTQISPVLIRRYAQAMVILGDRLHHLVRDLTEFVRLKSQPPAEMGEVFSLAELVADNFELFRAQFREQGLRAHLAMPSEMCLIEGNPALLERALQNLIRNALQHNLPAGHLKITLAQTPATVSLRLSNSGPPVPAQVLQNLQSKHPKGSNHSHKGNGLGLFIVQEIVHLHRAQMQIESLEGEPIHITLSFPTWNPETSA